MSGKQIGLVAAAGSAVLLLAAFVFQALGYAPCAMCLWQRYPHGVAIGVGLLLLIGLPVLPLLVVGAASAQASVTPLCVTYVSTTLLLDTRKFVTSLFSLFVKSRVEILRGMVCYLQCCASCSIHVVPALVVVQ